jgi:hypothetical protein
MSILLTLSTRVNAVGIFWAHIQRIAEKSGGQTGIRTLVTF